MKTKIFKFFSLLGLLFMAIPLSMSLSSCNPTNNDQVETLTVRDIILDTSECKTEFAYGEKFTAEGLKVTAILSDKSERDIPLSSCRISKVNTTPGKRKVSVTYARKTKRYEVVFLEKPMPAISEESLFNINGSGIYKIQAENINLSISGVKSNGENLILDNSQAENGKLLANYGVKDNYFGFTFNSDKDYDNSSIVLKLANPSKEDYLYFSEDMTIHLNYKGTSDNGILDIKNGVPLVSSPDNLLWSDYVIHGANIKQGNNTLTFTILGENVPYIDCISIYAGKYFSNSILTLANEGENVTKEFEDMGLERIITRDDYLEFYKLKQGEICVLNNNDASDGKGVFALMANSKVSTVIRAESDSTVEIVANAASGIDWNFSKDTTIKLDSQTIKIRDFNIRGGNPESGEIVWKKTSFGFFDLTAGDHLLEIDINSSHANFDNFVIKTVSQGKFIEHPDLYLNEVNTFIVEGEDLDPSGVYARPDYAEIVIGATHGAYHVASANSASGYKYIDGFSGNSSLQEKTTFTLEFYLAGDATLEINAVARSSLGVNFSIKDQVLVSVDEVQFTPNPVNLAQYYDATTNSYNGTQWIETTLLRKNFTAGLHTFKFEVLNYFFDLDCLKFKALSMYGYGSDLVVNQKGEYVVEAENLDPTGFIAADDFIAAGAISSKENEYCVRNDTYASNGKYICGFASNGSSITTTFQLKEDATVSITAIARSSIGINFSAESHVVFHLDGEKLSNIENKSLSSKENEANKWVTVKLVDNVRLTKGTHTLKLTTVSFGNIDLDSYVFDIA